MENITVVGGAVSHLCSLFRKDKFREPKFTQRYWWRRPSPGVGHHVDLCMSVNFSEGSPSKWAFLFLDCPKEAGWRPFRNVGIWITICRTSCLKRRMFSEDINIDISLFTLQVTFIIFGATTNVLSGIGLNALGSCRPLLQWIQRSEIEADYLPHLVLRLRMCGVTYPLPRTTSCCAQGRLFLSFYGKPINISGNEKKIYFV
jgi:hypothetical protein